MFDQLFNSNGISEIAFAFFTALFSFAAVQLKITSDTRKEARNATKASVEARESAEATIVNTKNVSNGFAGNVLGELRKLNEGQQKLADSFKEHLEWHLEQEGKK
jgi:hypothetical protein